MQESRRDIGIKRLVERWRAEFRRPENIQFYNPNDYKNAEKRYIKLRMDGRLEPAGK